MVKKKMTVFLVMCLTLVLAVPSAWALSIVLEPDNAQREVGDKVRVHIYADGAVNLISMGVKVSFDNTVLEVTEASKYEVDSSTGWVMNDDEAVPSEYRTPTIETLADINANGVLTMVGGNLNGSTTAGLSGKVLLGWVVFEAIANGNSDIHVDFGRVNPNTGETYHNFVRLGGTVDEPTNLPGDLGIICVVDGACSGDVFHDGMVNMTDFGMIRGAMGASFPNGDYDVKADINANGMIDMTDFGVVRAQMGTASCPACP